MQKENRRTFLHDAVDIVALSTHTLESDDFTRCFQVKSRSEMDSSGVFYFISFFVRYFILFPVRLFLLVLVLLIYAILISRALIYNSENKMELAYVFIIKSLTFILGARLVHHGEKKKMDAPHIFVSNHTSFVDFILLSSYNFPHACVSENHGGLFYFFFQLILSRNGSIAFKRCEKSDRSLVKKRMVEHVSKKKLPMLVFPEGTCVNNEFSVMFQKGVFELDIAICPVAIKYKRRLLDPYWNRRRHGFAFHLFYLMTRWFIEADIYWMPPLHRLEDESPVDYAFRTKTLISEKAGLKNSLWNGYLKSSPAIKDRELLKIAFRRAYIQRETIQNTDLDNVIDQSSYYNQPTISISTSADHTFTLFGSIPYKRFINEILKDYTFLKCIPSKEQQVLVADLLSKASAPQHISKKGCLCIKKAIKHNRKKQRFRYCRLDVIRKLK